MKTVILLCGPAGSGKSTWAKGLMKRRTCGEIHIISRDEIRFSILEERGGGYFDYEREVWKKFVEKIYSCITSAEEDATIIIDQTNLTSKARTKLLRGIHVNWYRQDVVLVAVNFMTSEEECVRRNSGRLGYALVPEDVVREMCKTFQPAKKDEGAFHFDSIDYVREEG